ncbi:hypothetical protein SUGI_0111010 [Cryptomeria japonica]|nr:hypothetical protein SUGI_0111010 [Cryptomeria japonica]
MAQGFRSSPLVMGLPFGIGGLDVVCQVEAKYPALLFKQQLTTYLEKIYGIIRDNLKEDISTLLGLCIQAPRTSRASMVKASRLQANANALQQQKSMLVQLGINSCISNKQWDFWLFIRNQRNLWMKLPMIFVQSMVLSIQQLYRINTMYWDDKYDTHSLSQDVIANMRVLMTEDSNSSLGKNFLLDDDSRSKKLKLFVDSR